MSVVCSFPGTAMWARRRFSSGGVIRCTRTRMIGIRSRYGRWRRDRSLGRWTIYPVVLNVDGSAHPIHQGRLPAVSHWTDILYALDHCIISAVCGGRVQLVDCFGQYVARCLVCLVRSQNSMRVYRASRGRTWTHWHVLLFYWKALVDLLHSSWSTQLEGHLRSGFLCLNYSDSRLRVSVCDRLSTQLFRHLMG